MGLMVSDEGKEFFYTGTWWQCYKKFTFIIYEMNICNTLVFVSGRLFLSSLRFAGKATFLSEVSGSPL